MINDQEEFTNWLKLLKGFEKQPQPDYNFDIGQQKTFQLLHISNCEDSTVANEMVLHSHTVLAINKIFRQIKAKFSKFLLIFTK